MLVKVGSHTLPSGASVVRKAIGVAVVVTPAPGREGASGWATSSVALLRLNESGTE